MFSPVCEKAGENYGHYRNKKQEVLQHKLQHFLFFIFKITSPSEKRRPGDAPR